MQRDENGRAEVENVDENATDNGKTIANKNYVDSTVTNAVNNAADTLDDAKNDKITVTENDDVLQDTDAFIDIQTGVNPTNAKKHSLLKLVDYLSAKGIGSGDVDGAFYLYNDAHTQRAYFSENGVVIEKLTGNDWGVVARVSYGVLRGEQEVINISDNDAVVFPFSENLLDEDGNALPSSITANGEIQSATENGVQEKSFNGSITGTINDCTFWSKGSVQVRNTINGDMKKTSFIAKASVMGLTTEKATKIAR